MSIDILGFIGGMFLVVGFIPQVYVVFKNKKIDDISLLFIIFQIITCIILMSYTLIIKALPLFIANTGIIIQLIMLLYAKLKFKNNNNLNIDKNTQTQTITQNLVENNYNTIRKVSNI